jgi:hypothetical protein
MTSKSPVRSCEDVDESVLSYAEIKALAAGNPKIKEKMELDVQVAKLRVAKTSHQTSQYTLQDKLRKELPAKMAALENRMSRLRKDIDLRDADSPKMPEPDRKDSEKSAKEEKEKFSMTINGMVYDKRDEAGKELMALTNVYHSVEPIKIGSYHGFDMMLEYNPHFTRHHLTLKGNDIYWIDMGDSASGNITKLNNILNGFEGKVSKTEGELRDCANQVRLAQEQLEKPFTQEGELAEKSARLAKLNLELNIDRHGGVDDEEELTLSEDEEYDYRNELADTGINEADLFSRKKDDPDEVVVGVGEELTEQGKNDTLRAEIESGAMLDIDGVHVEEIAQSFDGGQEQEGAAVFKVFDGFAGTPNGTPLTSADLYGEKMNLSNYRDFHYPKAAQFIDIHDARGQYAYIVSDGDIREYHLLVAGIVNATLQEQHIAKQSLNPRSSNEEYHFIRDYAMTRVCKELELPDSPMPEPVSGLSDTDMAALKERGEKLAELSLYGHLPEAEREKVLAEMKSSEIPEKDPTEERKALIAEARRKLAEDGAMPIITDAMEGRAYEGEILEIGSAYAVQKIDEGRGIIHNLNYLKDFKRMINESGVPYLEITYDREMNGSIGAREAAEQGKTASMGR